MTSKLGKEEAAVDRPGSPVLRRRFESAREWVVRGFLAVGVIAVLGVVLAFVTPPHDHLRAADWQLDGGAVTSFEVGKPKMVQRGPEPVWIVRLDGDRFAAFAAVCRQQHCVLRWNPVLRIFSCPCHHGTYDLEGHRLTGSSEEALRAFFVNIKGGRIRVHLRRTTGDEV